ncbi:hypothetical protein [Azohydromonas caseinilytica]|uniref:DNA topoisomerase type IA zn finger domain-containing protein n=1 Tax=Azohydromonas caseinilytica TaxID=2728836 RepID=A0A848F5D5_9BURK|nr:hypothetical protein [Azohydromonas caseinilytica]NML13583.1 hypothetical protein [Azohydromonas caseinilytica]
MTHKKDPPAASFTGLLTRLPWWVGVALALAAFTGLDRLTQPPASATAQLLASVGRVLLPLLCLLAAAVSAWQRRLGADASLHAAAQDTTAPLFAPAQPPDFEDTVPPCPMCNGAMVRRISRRDGEAGRVVWRCMSHPGCAGKREAE